MNKCDFCAETPIAWWIKCHRFLIPFPEKVDATPMMSDEGWAACEECGKLVFMENWDALLTRVLQIHEQSNFYVGEPVPTFLKSMYDLLRKNMKEIKHLYRSI